MSIKRPKSGRFGPQDTGGKACPRHRMRGGIAPRVLGGVPAMDAASKCPWENLAPSLFMTFSMLNGQRG